MKITSDFLKELIRQQIVLERAAKLPKSAIQEDEDQMDEINECLGFDEDED